MSKEISERPTVEQLDLLIERLERKRLTRKAITSSFVIIIVFAAVAVLVATLWFPVYQVQQRSMEPAMYEGDLLIFTSLGEIHRGDIVAFRYNNQLLIKRVVAFGGEWIILTDDGTVLIDGIPLDEPYLLSQIPGDSGIEYPYQVPTRRYFVLGDNRLSSTDSRNAAIGAVSRDQIAGKALLRIWPPSRLGTVK